MPDEVGCAQRPVLRKNTRKLRFESDENSIFRRTSGCTGGFYKSAKIDFLGSSRRLERPLSRKNSGNVAFDLTRGLFPEFLRQTGGRFFFL